MGGTIKCAAMEVGAEFTFQVPDAKPPTFVFTPEQMQGGHSVQKLVARPSRRATNVRRKAGKKSMQEKKQGSELYLAKEGASPAPSTASMISMGETNESDEEAISTAVDSTPVQHQGSSMWKIRQQADVDLEDSAS